MGGDSLMSNPIKILEIKGKNWMDGISIQTGLALGGNFQSAANFDPNETMGYLQPSLSAVTIDAATITTQVNHLTSIASGTSGFVFAYGDRAGTGAKQLYRIDLSNNTVIDYTTSINQNATTGALTGDGVTSYLGRLVYGQSSSLRSNLLTPTAGTDINILTSALTSTVNGIAFAIGADGVLYYTANGGIGKILSVTSTAGNTGSAFTFTDTTLVSRDITSDGRYLVIMADDNSYKVTTTSSRCRVFFWDMVKTKADVIWDIPDSYLIGGRYVDGRVYIIGYSGLWTCTINTPPKLIFPLTTTKLPPSAAAITVSGNILYWASGATGAQVYAYGSKIGTSRLFNPYQSSGSSDLHTALVSSGSYFMSSTTAPSVFLLNSGSTRSNATVQTVTTPLSQPYKFAYLKVTLKSPMSAGMAIGTGVYNGNGSVIMDTNTKSFSINGAKQTLIFEPKSVTNAFNVFEDVAVLVNPQAGAIIQRVALYGYPTDDYSQAI